MAVATPTNPALERVVVPAEAARRRRWLRVAGGVLLAVVLAEPARMLLGHNLHTVVPGQVYRSAQPPPGWLRSYVKSAGIRTVINLRGMCYPQEWYIEQALTLQELGISLEDICLSAGRLPAQHELRLLVLALENAERPLLLHCRHGADRTGLAACMVLLLEQDISLEEARRQLSPRFGHLALSRMKMLGRFFDMYREWLERDGRAHSRANFRHWVMDVYRGGNMQYELEEVTCLTPAPRVGLPAAYRVRVRNTSPYAWRFRPGSTAGIHLGYFLWKDDGVDDDAMLDHHEVDRAALLDAVVGPGETFTAMIVTKPLVAPGPHRLRIDMVEEGHCWFYQVGAEPYETTLDVRE
jgi:protein tyrosine phosphatase (PTP) superfamily phosphohydrolase (DUF442 family)